MDPRIIRRTAAQFGVVTRRQLLADDLPADTIREIVRTARLERVSYGVYVLPGTPETPEQELMVAALRCGPQARVAGERLLALLGIREAQRDGPFTVLTRPGRRVTGVQWTVRPNPCPVDLDAAAVIGIPSFPPARNLLEAAVARSDDAVERLVDGLRWSRHRIRDLRRMVVERPDHPGSVRLRASGLIAVDAGESPPERDLFPLFAHLGPRRQAWIAGQYRVDLYFPVATLVLEYDGPAHLAPARRAADADRDDDLHAMGIRVVRLTAEDVRDEEVLVRRIEAIVARRAAMGAGAGLA